MIINCWISVSNFFPFLQLKHVIFVIILSSERKILITYLGFWRTNTFKIYFKNFKMYIKHILYLSHWINLNNTNKIDSKIKMTFFQKKLVEIEKLKLNWIIKLFEKKITLFGLFVHLEKALIWILILKHRKFSWKYFYNLCNKKMYLIWIQNCFYRKWLEFQGRKKFSKTKSSN